MPAFGDLVAKVHEMSAQRGARSYDTSRSLEACSLILERCGELEASLRIHREDKGMPMTAVDLDGAVTMTAERLLRVSRILRSAVAAVAGVHLGQAGGRVRYRRPAARRLSILFVDLSESFKHAAEHDPDEDARWKNDGLNLIAQWGAAFGGREIKFARATPSGWSFRRRLTPRFSVRQP